MRWKKFLAWSAFLGIGFVSGTTAGLFVFRRPHEAKAPAREKMVAAAPALSSPTPITPVFSPSPTPQKPAEKFLLTLSGDSICLYELKSDGSTVLLQQTGIDLQQLRKEDYENLCRGFAVDSLAEAKALCEDFGS